MDEAPLWVNACYQMILIWWSSFCLEWWFPSSFTSPPFLLIFIYTSLSKLVCLHNPQLQKELFRLRRACLSIDQCLPMHCAIHALLFILLPEKTDPSACVLSSSLLTCGKPLFMQPHLPLLLHRVSSLLKQYHLLTWIERYFNVNGRYKTYTLSWCWVCVHICVSVCTCVHMCKSQITLGIIYSAPFYFFYFYFLFFQYRSLIGTCQVAGQPVLGSSMSLAPQY